MNYLITLMSGFNLKRKQITHSKTKNRETNNHSSVYMAGLGQYEFVLFVPS